MTIELTLELDSSLEQAEEIYYQQLSWQECIVLTAPTDSRVKPEKQNIILLRMLFKCIGLVFNFNVAMQYTRQ